MLNKTYTETKIVFRQIYMLGVKRTRINTYVLLAPG